MVQHVQALRRGEAIDMPEYDFAADNRSSKTITVKPAPVIVIEGLFALLPHGANGPAVDIITNKLVSLVRDLGRA